MCKKLRFCSTLIIASLVTSCGYDDGQGELLPILPLTCTSSMDCKIGTKVIGECISGSCQRFCDSRDDCEPNTICESGVCRPIMDCPALQFNDEVVISYTDSAQGSQTMSVDNRGARDIYANRKCLQVFSHTPQASWRTLFKKDLVLDKNNLNKSSNADFTSDDFTFTIPQDALYTGVNFSGVTFMSLVYMVILQMGYESASQCFRPEVYNHSKDTFEKLDSYVAKYLYPVQDLALGNEDTLLSLCSGSVAGMQIDMQKYLTRYKILDGTSFDEHGNLAIFDEHGNLAIKWDDPVAEMSSSEFNQFNLVDYQTKKQSCSKDNSNCFTGICDCGADTTCEFCIKHIQEEIAPNEIGTEATCKNIKTEEGKSTCEYEYEYQMPRNLPSKGEMLKLAHNDYLKMVATKAECHTARQFLDVLVQLSSILMEIGMEEGKICPTTTATEIFLKYLNPEYKEDKGVYTYADPATHHTKFTDIPAELFTDILAEPMVNPLSMCDAQLSTAIIGTNDAIYLNNKNYQTVENDYTSYKSDVAYIPYCNRDDLGCNPAPNTPCSVDDGKALDATFKMLTQYPMTNQISTCMYALYGLGTFPLTQAFATSADMQVGKCADHEKVVSSMLDVSGFSNSAATLHEAMGTLLFNNTMDATQFTLDMLYAQYINPSYFWFSGSSLTPMRIVTKSERFNKNDLILENQFKANENIFVTSSNSEIKVPLATDSRISIFSDVFVEKTTSQTGYPLFKFSVQDGAQADTFVSSYLYEKANANSFVSGAALYQRSIPGACPNNVCSFYHHPQKVGDASGMICGGISYEVDSFNGYIVLTQDDINQYGGTGVLISDKTNP